MREESQRKKPWKATLPGGKKIAGVAPDTMIARSAIQMVPKKQQTDAALANTIAKENELRLCISSIDGRGVNYDALSGRQLDRLLDLREQQLVKHLFDKIKTPSAHAVDRFNESIAISRDGGEWRWRGRLVLGKELEQLEEAEAKADDAEAAVDSYRRMVRDAERQLEEDKTEMGLDNFSLSAQLERDREDLERLEGELKEAEAELAELADVGLELGGIVPDSTHTKRAVELTPKKLRKTQLSLQKESQENLLRVVVKSIGGQVVGEEQLDGVKLDEWLHPKEQHAIIAAVEEMSVPDEDEVSDFLASIELG